MNEQIISEDEIISEEELKDILALECSLSGPHPGCEEWNGTQHECSVCGKPMSDSREPICGDCDAEGYWMDPMGTIHSPDADPLAAYE